MKWSNWAKGLVVEWGCGQCGLPKKGFELGVGAGGVIGVWMLVSCVFPGIYGASPSRINLSESRSLSS